ncbi:unnamed protein product [Haemonchus placei]|uniref:Uncharacterized protein n=1 Tax=Haemonchus placei TaxID=6290 RepID=A0A0N4W5W5_HAEPC|nr:unnamed protein product [Haemonchus placei]
MNQAKPPIEDDVVYFTMELPCPSRMRRLLELRVAMDGVGRHGQLGVEITDDDYGESVVFFIEPLQMHMERFQLIFFVAC